MIFNGLNTQLFLLINFNYLATEILFMLKKYYVRLFLHPYHGGWGQSLTPAYLNFALHCVLSGFGSNAPPGINPGSPCLALLFNGLITHHVVAPSCSTLRSDRKSTRLNSSHITRSRMPSSA